MELDSNLRNLPPLPVCNVGYCRCVEHLNTLDLFWNKLVYYIKSIGSRVFGIKKRVRGAVPGWNMYVRHFYDQSRNAFLNWKAGGSPNSGSLAQVMRISRANFKRELRWCKRNEDAIRADIVATKFRQGNVVKFWREVKKMKPDTYKIPLKIDDACDADTIVGLWRNKFMGVLNSTSDSLARDEFDARLRDATITQVSSVSLTEMCCIIDGLPGNKSPITDDIPSEVFKNSSFNFLNFLTMFVNDILYHGHIPCTLSDVVILPTIKNKLKDSSKSNNYRPIAVSSIASKLIELILYDRLRVYLVSSPHQFGFKSAHSTETCVFAVKEVIDYYLSLNTPVFACFIDIKSAFDRVVG